ncbi:uncharacterized protein J3R85_004047 [Psidium guajava]|nr:uncharacterized protein J3R85_004047 [Psidium guajava]
MQLKFAEHLKEAVTYIEQGDIQVGPEMVTDPAFPMRRNMEDFVMWVGTSNIKRKVPPVQREVRRLRCNELLICVIEALCLHTVGQLTPMFIPHSYHRFIIKIWMACLICIV